MKTRWIAMPLVAGALVAALGGCGSDGDEPELVIAEGCNPIASEYDCLLPYPSDVFLQDDADGRRVVLSEAAMPRTKSGMPTDPLRLHAADGFSPGNQILVLLPGGIDDAALVGAADDLERSVDDGSPTLIIEAASGERIMHIAELDPRADSDARRALVLRPLVRLADDTRYLVAVRSLTQPDGAAVPTPAAFARLRDGNASSHPQLAALASRYEADIFPALASAGVSRESLQLAWDFTTRTRQNAIGDMLEVRRQTMEAFASTPPAITVVSVEDQPDAHVERRIEATLTVPLFLEDAEPMALLARGADGKVTRNGSVEVPFTIVVPTSVANRPATDPPARVMQFGHGFFGDRREIDGFIDELADEKGFVVVAADWWGMSEPDRTPLSDALVSDAPDALRFTDRVHQAMANFMAVAYATQGGLAGLPEMQLGTLPLFDPDQLYFYGISMGHILGGSYLALSPQIERGALGSGGAGLSFMMFRARPWVVFLALLQLEFPDALDQQKLAMLMQSSMDRIDPLSYAPLVMREPLADGPSSRNVLMQIGIGDAAVPNLSAHLHARSLGLSHLTPAPRPIAGLPTTAGPADTAIVEFDFGIDPLPGVEAKPPSEDNEVHEAVRRLQAAKDQLDGFLRPGGQIVHTCDGPCDPE